jgi:hypothetical protein
MSLLADALQPFVTPALSAVRDDSLATITLSDLIIAPAAAYDLAIRNAARAVDLDFRDPLILSAALAADANRLASASFQTVATIGLELEQRDSAAWAMVKLYYAAFYAGHALIRLCGESCSYLYRNHTTRLANVATALGITPGFSIDTGLYHCTTQNAAISYVRVRGAVGGAHETFWSIFGDYLQRTSTAVLQGSMTRLDAQAVFAQITDATRLLSKSGGYSWLSEMRNDLQYKLQHGLWYPEKMRVQSLRTLSRLALQWKGDPMRIDLRNAKLTPLSEFIACCAFIIAACRQIVWRISDRSLAGNRCFLRAGPTSILNDLGVVK